MSLKVLRQGNKSQIKGSYTNLVDALVDDGAIKYIVAYKDQEGDKVSSIQIEEFDITRENLLPLLNLTKSNRNNLAFDGKEPEESFRLLSKAKSWEELYPMLQRTQGYTKKISGQKEEETDTPAETDNDRLKAGIDKIDEQLLQEAEGTQWYTNYYQLQKNKDVFRLKSLGRLDVSPEALEKTAEQYMDILQGRITTLFRAVSELSKNINSYFTSTEDQRQKAIEDGNKAIQNADQIADSMEEVTKQDAEK